MEKNIVLETAKLILLQVDHNRDCGKDDKVTVDEIVNMIGRRLNHRELLIDFIAELNKKRVTKYTSAIVDRYLNK